MKLDPTLRLARPARLNHGNVVAALAELRAGVDPTIYCSTSIPESLTAARARRAARQ